MKYRILFGLSVIVLLAYGYVNLATANQTASPFLAIIFIYFAYMLHTIRKDQKELIEKINLLDQKRERFCAEEKENSTGDGSTGDGSVLL